MSGSVTQTVDVVSTLIYPMLVQTSPPYSFDLDTRGDGTPLIVRLAGAGGSLTLSHRTIRGENGVQVVVVDNDRGALVIKSNIDVSPNTVRAGSGMTITGSNVVAGGTLTVAIANILPSVTTFYSAVVNERGQVTGGATIPPATSSLSPANIVGSTGIAVTGTISPTGGTVTLALTPTLPSVATFTTVFVSREGRILGGAPVDGDGSIGTIPIGHPSAGAPILPIRTAFDASTTFPAVPLVTNPGAATIMMRQIQAGDGIVVAPGQGTVVMSAAPPRERHIPVDLFFNPNGSLVGCSPTSAQPNISMTVQDDGDLQVIHPDAEVLDVTAWIGGPNNTLIRVPSPSFTVTLSIDTGSTIVSNLTIGALGGRGQVGGRLVFLLRNL